MVYVFNNWHNINVQTMYRWRVALLLPSRWCTRVPATVNPCCHLQVGFCCVLNVQQQYKRVNDNFYVTTVMSTAPSNAVVDFLTVWPRLADFPYTDMEWKYFFRLIGCEYNAKCTPECPILQVLPCDLTRSVVTISFIGLSCDEPS